MREVDGLNEELVERGYGGRLRSDEPLSGYTSLRIGGPADLLIVTRELAELGELIQVAQAAGVPSLVIGGGTNILVADAGVRGLVIVNACRGCSIDGQGLLTAQSGALLSKLSRRTVSQGWKGLEWAAGIPGTGFFRGMRIPLARPMAFARGGPVSMPYWICRKTLPRA